MNKLVYKCFVLKVNDTTLKIYDINIFTIFFKKLMEKQLKQTNKNRIKIELK